MSDVLDFSFNGATVRTVVLSGEPWFVVYDLCLVFGMKSNGSHDLVKRLNADWYDSIELVDRIGRRKKFLIVNESGLYNIILRSDKPIAKPFQEWVTNDVLPTIRKTGKYEIVQIPAVTPSALSAELNHINELFRLWKNSFAAGYADTIKAAISELVNDFADKIKRF